MAYSAKTSFRFNLKLENCVLLGHAGATAVLILTAVCFGLVPLFAKGLMETGTNSSAIAFYRYGFTTLIMFPFFPFAREKWRETLIFTSTGLFMGLSWIGYLEAINMTSVAVASTIYMSYPVFTMLLAWPIAGQQPTVRGLLSIFLVLISVYISFSPQNLSGIPLIAFFWSLLAPISFGLVIVIISSRLHRLSIYEKMTSIALGATLGLAPLTIVSSSMVLINNLADHWFLIIGISFFTALLPQFLYTLASPLVGPNHSAATGTFELPTMLVIGWLVFGENVGGREIFSALLIISAILLAPVIKKENNPDK